MTIRGVCASAVITIVGLRTMAAAASAYTVVDLTPSGPTDAIAWDVAGGQQVGSFHGPATGNQERASLWNGSAASRVDLHPAGYDSSAAYGTDGVQQVGFAVGPTTESGGHAILWSGSAASAVLLHPAGFSESHAVSVRGGDQVGSGFHVLSQHTHALMWRGRPKASSTCTRRG